MSLTAITPTAPVAGTFHAVYVREQGGKFQTLGDVVGGTLEIQAIEEANSRGQNKATQVHAVSAKCSMRQASLIELELLPDLRSGTNDFLFKMSDAAAIPGDGIPVATEGWVLLLASQVNVKPVANPDGDITTTRKIELDWAGTLKSSEYAAAVKAAIVEDDFEATSDTGTFHAIGTYTAALDGGRPTPSHIVPNGVASVTIQDVAGGSAVDLGAVQDFKCKLEFLSDPKKDERGRHEVKLVNIDANYGWKSTDATNLLLIPSMVGKDINAVVTYFDGLVLTLNDVVGISGGLSVPASFNDNRVVKFKHTGTIPVASFNGIVSGS